MANRGDCEYLQAFAERCEVTDKKELLRLKTLADGGDCQFNKVCPVKKPECESNYKRDSWIFLKHDPDPWLKTEAEARARYRKNFKGNL